MEKNPPRKSLDRINEICLSLAFLPVPILKVSTVDVPSLPVKAKVKAIVHEREGDLSDGKQTTSLVARAFGPSNMKDRFVEACGQAKM